MFSNEDALEAVRDGWDRSKGTRHSASSASALPPTAQLMKEVCTTRAKVCPKSRWKRWHSDDRAGPDEVPSLVKIVPRQPDETHTPKKRGGSAPEPAGGSWVADVLMASPLFAPVFEAFGAAPFIIFLFILLLPQLLVLLSYFLYALAAFIGWIKGLPPMSETPPKKSVDDVASTQAICCCL